MLLSCFLAVITVLCLTGSQCEVMIIWWNRLTVEFGFCICIDNFIVIFPIAFYDPMNYRNVNFQPDKWLWLNVLTLCFNLSTIHTELQQQRWPSLSLTSRHNLSPGYHSIQRISTTAQEWWQLCRLAIVEAAQSLTRTSDMPVQLQTHQ